MRRETDLVRAASPASANEFEQLAATAGVTTGHGRIEVMTVGKQSVNVMSAALLVVAASGCAHDRASAIHQGAEDLASTESLIQMRRGGCPPDKCPVYSVSVFLDGTVLYDGKANVSVLGRHTAKLSVEDLPALLAQIDAMDLLDSPEQCCVCPDATADSHFVIVDYRPGSVVKTVLHDEACKSAPPALGALEQAIDRLAGTQRWTSSLAQAGIPPL